LLIDYLPLKTTINGQYYATVLLKLRNAIKEKKTWDVDMRSLAAARLSRCD